MFKYFVEFQGESAFSDSESEVLQRARSCGGRGGESLSSLCGRNFLISFSLPQLPVWWLRKCEKGKYQLRFLNR
jgi:hypothetical protein